MVKYFNSIKRQNSKEMVLDNFFDGKIRNFGEIKKIEILNQLIRIKLKDHYICTHCKETKASITDRLGNHLKNYLDILSIII